VKDLLDTNACVDYLRGRYPSVVERTRTLPLTDLCLSTVVIAERAGAGVASSSLRRARSTTLGYAAGTWATRRPPWWRS